MNKLVIDFDVENEAACKALRTAWKALVQVPGVKLTYLQHVDAPEWFRKAVVHGGQE